MAEGQVVEDATPGVVVGYRLYCAGMLGLLLLAILLIWEAAAKPPPGSALGIAHGLPADLAPLLTQIDEKARADQTARAVGATVLCLLFAAPFGFAFSLGRTPGAWVYHIVVLCLGIGGCTLPFCVLMLILWFQPRTQAYFGRSPGETRAGAEGAWPATK